MKRGQPKRDCERAAEELTELVKFIDGAVLVKDGNFFHFVEGQAYEARVSDLFDNGLSVRLVPKEEA